MLCWSDGSRCSGSEGKQKADSDAMKAGRKLRPQEGISRTLRSAAYANQELKLNGQDGRALAWRARERPGREPRRLGCGERAGGSVEGVGWARGQQRGGEGRHWGLAPPDLPQRPAFAGVRVAAWLSRDAGLLLLCWVYPLAERELSSPSASGM